MTELPQVQDASTVSTKDSITVKWKKPDYEDLTGYEISCFHIGKLEKKDASFVQTDDQDENNLPLPSGEPKDRKDVEQPGAMASGDGEKDEDALEYSSELVLKKEENGDSGVSSEADEGKTASPQKSKRETNPIQRDKLVFTTIVDAELTETVIGGLKSATEYRLEVTTLCEEQKSEMVILTAKTKSSEIVFGLIRRCSLSFALVLLQLSLIVICWCLVFLVFCVTKCRDLLLFKYIFTHVYLH